MMPQPMSTRYADLDRDLVQSLAKGLAVIEAFSAETPAMTLSEVARRTGISPGSAQRILRTLVSLGYVGVEDGRFSLKPRTLQLGYAYLAALPLASIAQPMLSALMRATDETCSLALLDGSDVVYVARAPARRLRRDYMAVGTRLPAHATSVGKVLLAALPPPALEALLAQETAQRLTPNTLTEREALRAAIRLAGEQGYAVNDQEAIMGLRSLGVPVTSDGRVVAAMGLSVEVSRVSRDDLEGRLLPSLREMAAALSAAIGLATTPVSLV